MTEDLTEIDGVGPAIAEALEEAGFETVDDVLTASVDELAAIHMLGESSAASILEDEDGGKGRPSKLEKYEDDIFEAARQGLTYEGIARVAGVGVSTLHDWREAHEDFSESLERARSEAERELIQDVDAEFVLERSYGYVKTEKREVDMDADIDQTTTQELGEDEKEIARQLIQMKQQQDSGDLNE
ncbi:helix-hairpin-helix domain-containing protein [Natrinema salaciae]|uniref:Helix-hairpin-helix domain-containing protein n=1 Tax=Natrinema salaciae TaxID=1186196 RepID=A0A1H9F067_9EURY|nr:helix-hairpin-helix domain-containing protein [Natrinema salaciae]SEQ31285.1 Helix-hairpin-helix domain-containing protein [Natrinema salaciae]